MIRLFTSLILASIATSSTPAVPPPEVESLAMGTSRLPLPCGSLQGCNTWTLPKDLGGLQIEDPTIYASQAAADAAIADGSAIGAALLDAIAELWPEFDGCEYCYTAPDTCLAGVHLFFGSGSTSYTAQVGSQYRVFFIFNSGAEASRICDPCEA